MKISVLMIDDDVALTELVSEDLARYGFAVDAVHSGELGLDQLRNGSYALVILDVMLPLMNGFEILSHLRQFSAVPVLILTARGNPMDVALGFRMGSDDYLAKPFGSEELALRIHAIMRRCYQLAAPSPPASGGDRTVLRLGDTEITPGSRQVFKDGVEVRLTSAEFDILHRLFESPGEIVTREELCRVALDRELNSFDRSVDNLMASLRKKLSFGDANGGRIQAARGRGYIYTPR
ncbi:MAG: response regulator transcription factor [Acidobacteria bacterium]|nr:response regulator transcription factor [Acidobacteriota bacterium]